MWGQGQRESWPAPSPPSLTKAAGLEREPIPAAPDLLPGAAAFSLELVVTSSEHLVLFLTCHLRAQQAQSLGW